MKVLNSVLTYIDVLGGIMMGSIIAKIKECNWSTVTALFLVVWYVIDLFQRIRITFGMQEIQFDLQDLYILIDVMTVAYLVYIKAKPKFSTILYKILWYFLFVWFVSFTVIDVAVIPLNQPNSIWFNIFCVLLASSTLGMIISYEIKSRGINVKKLLKW